MKRNQNVAPISEMEWSIVLTCRRATFPVGSVSKRFIRDMLPASKMSDRGRCFLAYVANRFRRQYELTPEQRAWVEQWLAKYTPLEPEPSTEHTRPEPTLSAKASYDQQRLAEWERLYGARSA